MAAQVGAVASWETRPQAVPAVGWVLRGLRGIETMVEGRVRYTIERDGRTGAEIEAQIAAILRSLVRADRTTQYEVLASFTPDERGVADRIAAPIRRAHGHAEVVTRNGPRCRKCGLLVKRSPSIYGPSFEVAYHPGRFDDLIVAMR